MEVYSNMIHFEERLLIHFSIMILLHCIVLKQKSFDNKTKNLM